MKQIIIPGKRHWGWASGTFDYKVVRTLTLQVCSNPAPSLSFVPEAYESELTARSLGKNLDRMSNPEERGGGNIEKGNAGEGMRGGKAEMTSNDHHLEGLHAWSAPMKSS